MQRKAYEDHLRKQEMAETEIIIRCEAIQTFLRRLEQSGVDAALADKEDFYRIAEDMIAEGSNTIENFDAVCEYLLWADLRAQYIALTEITDCYNGMDTLAEAVEARHGTDIRRQIFTDPAPPLGAREAERCAYTRTVMRRMADLLTEEEAQAAWFEVQHGIPKSYWKRYDAREREQAVPGETVEAFLQRKRRERNQNVQRMHDQNALWFTMEITDEVLDFVIHDLHMQIGEHNGRKGIIITKVPYQPAKVLHAADAKMKRYYACHCPLTREAILREEPISPFGCYCSLGHASHFLKGLGLELQGEVLQSVVQGDERCRFIFYLPEDAGRRDA
ncbi:MAG TPA: hypothetical protein PK537_10835 [Candidatus Limiplasma sp.]|nr:hypothetical protein [Candidatus Limiplasma sp.]